MSNEIDNAGKIVGVAGQLVSLAKDSPQMVEAGQEFASSALTVSKAIKNCLLPIAVVNYGFDKARNYFQAKFADDLEEATSKIPQENIVEPKPSIAAPIIKGLAFSHEEPSLKEMYLALLSSSMDGRNPNLAHPSFAEIIKQMSSEEAHLLRTVLCSRTSLPISKIQGNIKETGGHIVLHWHVMNLTDTETGEPSVNDSFPSFVGNWARLGLVEIDYSSYLTKEDSYDWVKKRPEFLSSSVDEMKGVELDFTKGILTVTPFGRSFAKAVL